jgi:hypothetical protein
MTTVLFKMTCTLSKEQQVSSAGATHYNYKHSPVSLGLNKTNIKQHISLEKAAGIITDALQSYGHTGVDVLSHSTTPYLITRDTLLWNPQSPLDVQTLFKRQIPTSFLKEFPNVTHIIPQIDFIYVSESSHCVFARIKRCEEDFLIARTQKLNQLPVNTVDSHYVTSSHATPKCLDTHSQYNHIKKYFKNEEQKYYHTNNDDTLNIKDLYYNTCKEKEDLFYK